mgnify:CR=1 FL=1
MISGLQTPYDLCIGSVLSVAHIQTTKNWRQDNLMYTDRWVISYTLSGVCHYRWGNRNHTIRTGDVLLFGPGFFRSAQSSDTEPWEFIVIKVGLTDLNPEAENMLRALPVHLPNAVKKLGELIQKCESIWCKKRSGYIVRCKGIIYEILFLLLREAENRSLNVKASLRIAPAMDLLEQNMRLNYSTETLAEASGLSVSHFRTLFRHVTGFSPVQYQNYLSMARAKDLLLSGNISVSEAANMIGIGDIYYFSRMFKQYMGVSPSNVKEK